MTQIALSQDDIEEPYDHLRSRPTTGHFTNMKPVELSSNDVTTMKPTECQPTPLDTTPKPEPKAVITKATS